MDKQEAFSQLLKDYEKRITPGGRRGVVVSYRKTLTLQVSIVFVESEDRLVILDVMYFNKSFRLVGIYAPNRSGLI